VTSASNSFAIDPASTVLHDPVDVVDMVYNTDSMMGMICASLQVNTYQDSARVS